MSSIPLISHRMFVAALRPSAAAKPPSGAPTPAPAKQAVRSKNGERQPAMRWSEAALGLQTLEVLAENGT